MTALLCARCGREITPGSPVEIVTAVDLDERRILTDDEALIVHAGGCADDDDGLVYAECRYCGEPHDFEAPCAAPDYAARCRAATTAQGLDPIVQLLLALDLPVEVDQTGGFVMVARVQVHEHSDASWLGITREQPERYLVCRYDGADDLDGLVLDDSATLADVVAAATAFVRDEVTS